MRCTDDAFAREASALQDAVADYFGGLYHGDVERLRRVFHPAVILRGEIDGQPSARALDEYLEVVRARKSPESLGEPFRMRVVSLERVNGIAVVRVFCPMFGYRYHDVLTLQKLEGAWRIVGKVFTHVPD